MQGSLENKEAEIEYLYDETVRELSRRNFADFFYLSHGKRYNLLRHQKLIAEKLQKILDGEQKHYIIEIPPQHGKSTVITETFPAYFLMQNPDKLAMVVSYSEELYKKFGRKNRDKFRMYANDLFGLNIDPISSSVSNWGVEGHLGELYSTSILGGATGRGSNLLIIDDPIKNRAEADSKTIRDKVYAEWQDTFYSRLSADGSVIVIMTRWHEDDLAGRLLKEMSLPWEEIKIPAIAEANDLLGRKIGEALAPEIGKDEIWAERTKAVTGVRGWTALYQQRPSPADGNMFKRKYFRFYVPNEDFKRKYGLGDDVVVLPRLFDVSAQSWDCAFKDTKNSDYVAGHLWSIKGANYYMIDRDHDRMDIVRTMQGIRNMSTKWPDAIAKYVEDKANGPAVIQMLRDEIPGLIPIEPEGGKEVRANATVPVFEAGNVFLPHPLYKPWSEEVIEEFVAFPNGANDDDVDAATQLINKLRYSSESLLERYDY
ncbi:phage terminase large subunit [Listeria grandensis]|uniref:Phage terminase large subunit n=1 Tax=Listeria grandensis TaxID=1494963 RepID=A0A7X0Y1B4_9LIST|nr:phage terminase large subunit [Listeria grandensis]MBC1935190.1 phage terminase large subunit [Listeria grandensis]